jgi:NADH-quinone oxidoreductase subunit H
MAGMTQSAPTNRGIPRPIMIGLIVLAVLVVLAIIVIANGQALFNAGDSALRFLFTPDARVPQDRIIMCSENSTCSIIHAVIFSAILFFIVLTGFAYTTLLERVLLARLQHRTGPNRVGPGGFLQPAADGVKLIFKEDIIPAGADKPVYYLAPILKAVPVLIVMAVIPFGRDLLVPWFDGNWYRASLSLADPNVGVLWLLAITSIGAYGVFLAGWASNNKYAMLGGLRATSQMISYELSLGLTMAVPVLIVGSMSLGDIVAQQRLIFEWFIFQNPLAAGILFIALLAEVNRAPFDLPEAEQELTAGFMTEYSGMKFALFMMGEYLGMIAISLIISSLYLGGYQDGFGLADSIPILGPLVLIGKVVLMLCFMIWIRATLPRIRYDRLMTLGWKVLLPLSLLAVAWTAISVGVGDAFGSPVAYGIAAGIFFVIVVGGAYYILSRGERASEDSGADLENDPIVTGEQRGPAFVGLQVLGGIIAIPFVLFDRTIKLLESIARAGGAEVEPQSKELAVSDNKDAAKTTGGD